MLQSENQNSVSGLPFHPLLEWVGFTQDPLIALPRIPWRHSEQQNPIHRRYKPQNFVTRICNYPLYSRQLALHCATCKRHVRLRKPWVAQQTKKRTGRNLHKNWFWLDLIHTYYSAEKWLDLVHTHSANCLPFIVHFGGPIAVTSKGLLFCLSHGQAQETLNMTIAQICKTSQHTSRNKLHRRAPVEPQVKASHARE